MDAHTADNHAALNPHHTHQPTLPQLLQHVLAHDGAALVTADHGNAEEMLIPGTDQVWTAHTTNPVPVVLVISDDSPLRNITLRPDGRLADVAPMILELIGLKQPDEMTGKSLIQNENG
jgi:2,3-bisphosphoglycerate-independent phosphoglycerate mutase